MSNPLLKTSLLPAFSSIQAEHIEPALDQLLASNRQRIADLLATATSPGKDFLASIEQWDDELDQLWSPVSHLHGVKNSDALRDAYNACLPKLTEYGTEMGQNTALYQAYKQLAESDVYEQLNHAEQKALDNALRDFTLSGIALEPEQQQRYGDIKKQLAELSTQFSNNVLDATHGWSKHIDNSEELSGIPDSVLQGYQQAAAAKDLTGYLISLDIPAYLPLMQYCDNAALRKEMYTAYTTRASDQGPNAGQWDNSELMDNILALRHELSLLLGFSNYAERSLVTKMAESPEQVESFLTDLAENSVAVAKKDFQELEAFAKGLGVEQLSAWDIPFYSEKLRLEKYDLSQEELRPYFPSDKVIDGMFTVVNRLFGIECVEVSDVETWHPDVRFYHLERDGELVAKFYLDIFAREHKRGGAWMADCRVRRNISPTEKQLPVAFLTCNFTPPTETIPSLLTHNEVTTLFHEFGHGLHHMLTEVECAAVSGINGVPWDAVELPSQFMENWCWEKEAIPLISGHYKTGEVLPDELLEKMLAAKNFQSGMMMVRQLEFSLFDMIMHHNYSPENPAPIQTVLDKVRENVAVVPTPEFNRFQHGFGHIFAGGYAAGYYSYKWAEVLSADAFSLFEEEGIFNQATGERFLNEILQRGGAQEPMELFKAFRGREPNVDALLRHSGIVITKAVA
ncbi:oligopeptidase A [Oceanicoccus sagamiensis]|uniref:oligopeptidase A n=1 Tax=Oceanicoccus sagamiensis TaxID=716816 RepID=A0A1X9NGI1_9GAMM|nr:oligopeptidase A [Oceanicoccus sagamiensis]ARN74057.1 oligopeptidase A [Oceanicoccus sagamiensis]